MWADHIMHSDVVKEIRNNNKKRVDKTLNEIKSYMRENYINKSEDAKTSDEAIAVFIYARKWNDIISSSHAIEVTSTSMAWSDMSNFEIGQLMAMIDNNLSHRRKE